MRLIPISCLIAAAGVVTSAQRAPRFDQYPVPVSKISPRPLDLRRHPEARAYKTRIADAINEGVNFAGHYIIVSWGCGTGCTNGGVIDARTDHTYYPDQMFNIDASYGDGYADKILEFHKNSRMLIIRGHAGGKGGESARKEGDYYFEWLNNKFRLIRFIPLH